MAEYKIFKLITLGDSGVGKTTLIYRYCEGKFMEKMTVGFDLIERKLNVCGEKVALQFWDTAGEEKYKQIIVSNFYRSVDAVVFVYDITRQSTLDSIETWMRELEKHDLEHKPKILIGNKSDCATDENSVPIKATQKLAAKYNMRLFTTSALLDSENDHVEAIFMTLAKDVYNENKRNESLGTKTTDNINLKRESNEEKINVKANCSCDSSRPARR